MWTTILVALTLVDAEPTISEPTVADGIRVHRVTSEFQAGETSIRVLLPDCCRPGELLRTLYVLPVEAKLESRYGDGLAEARRLDLANKYRLLCVAPSFSHLPWFADHSADKTIRQESYLLRVVIPAVEQRYPVRKEQGGRLLVGFSKSGYGAWSLLLRHPDVFGKAAAWDAPLMKTAPDQFGMGPIYGSVANFEQYRIDLLLRGRSAALQADGPRLIHLGYGNFRQHHQQAERLLVELGIPHEYADGPKREHIWESGWLEAAIRRLCE